MRKIPYNAVDSRGKPISSFVEAESSSAAMSELRARGYTEIVLAGDGLTAMARPDLDGLSEKDLASVGEFEATIRAGAGLFGFLLEVLRKGWFVVATGLLIALWGWRADSVIGLAAGSVITSAIFVIALWNYRVLMRYDDLLRCEALGDGDRARGLINALRPAMVQPEMAFDLAVREACFTAQSGSYDDAFAIVAEHRDVLATSNPGLFEARVAAVCHAAGRYDDVIAYMRDACEKSGESPTALVDLALAHARFGDVATAAALVDRIVIDELPAFGMPFVVWIKGLVILRTGDGDPLPYLRDAVTGLLEFADMPPVWTSLGVCTGYYALALADIDETAAAGLIENVRAVVMTHGDSTMKAQIAGRFPDPG